jgi:hypothetical protein
MPDDGRVTERADQLLPEEEAAGSDDPEAQAAAILAESDERQADRRPAEERTSEDVTDPPP